MLKVTIYKTRHYGENEAKKLLAPIRASDAFSIEDAFSTEGYAREAEKKWLDAISSGMSRSEFLRRLTPVEGGMPPEAIVYAAKLNDYCFRNKTPRYFFERLPDEKPTQELRKRGNDSEAEYRRGLWRIVQGRIDEGVDLCYKSTIAQLALATERDKNASAHLSDAEQILRDTYPTLRDKDIIQLGIQIGFHHRPERFIQVPLMS